MKDLKLDPKDLANNPPYVLFWVIKDDEHVMKKKVVIEKGQLYNKIEYIVGYCQAMTDKGYRVVFE